MSNSKTLENKINSSFKWSFVGTIFSKLATPISTIILARLLTPEIYGITTAVTMVIAFCELLADSGFAKYLIYKDFNSKDDYEKYFSVSFYSSLIISLLISVVIIALSKPLSSLVSNSGYEIVLIASTIQIPIYTINSIYNADLKRSFKFNKIFVCNVVSSFIPLLVTVPLAFLGLKYWSLVIGATAMIFVQTIMQMFFSRQKIRLFFSFKLLKEMFSYSFAMMVEAFLVWLCTWLAVFLAGTFYNGYYVGLFKVSNTTITSIFGILSFTITSVLFPSLSRLKNDEAEFKRIFLKIQKIAICVVVPLGVGLFLFSKLVTSLMLGSNWSEASFIIGIISLSNIFKVCYSYFLSETFRAKGHIIHSIVFQVLTLIVQVASLLILGRISFDMFVIGYFISNIFYAIIAILYLTIFYKFSLFKLIKPVLPAIICSAMMVLLYVPTVAFNYSNIQQIGIILACVAIYFSTLAVLFRGSMQAIVDFMKNR